MPKIEVTILQNVLLRGVEITSIVPVIVVDDQNNNNNK
jgi:hypothetical protein